jgi:hypothetical protein
LRRQVGVNRPAANGGSGSARGQDGRGWYVCAQQPAISLSPESG